MEIDHSAARVLERLARGDRGAARRITPVIKSLADEPRPHGAVKMTGVDAWRVRTGDYRVVYAIADSVRVVTVTRIGHRREVYER